MNQDNLHIFGTIANHISHLSHNPDNAEYCQAAALNMARTFSRCYGSHPNSNEFKYAMSDAKTNLRLLKQKVEQQR
jgi:CRISPR/Cas system endoribonuclease Cas6 (RAMP superfamily)